MPYRMKTLKTHRYATRDMRAGDEFEVVSERDRRLLVALGRAEEVSEPQPGVTEPVHDEVGADSAVEAAAGVDEKPRRRYKRRDTRPES